MADQRRSRSGRPARRAWIRDRVLVDLSDFPGPAPRPQGLGAGGARWRSLPAPSPRILALDFTSPLQGHLVSEAGNLFGTRDGGRVWRRIPIGGRRAVGLSFCDARHGFLDVSRPDTFDYHNDEGEFGVAEVLRTDDGGHTWTDQRLDPKQGPRWGSSVLAVSASRALFGYDGRLLWTDTRR